jgi:hypothetical protein
MVMAIVILIGMIIYYQLNWSEKSDMTDIIFDYMIHHAVGEVMILVPILFTVISPYYFTFSKSFGVVSKLRYVSLAGGVINFNAWFHVKDSMSWHYWCLVLFGFSIVLFLAMKPLTRFLFKFKTT